MMVLEEWLKRGWKFNLVWLDICYRGENCLPYTNKEMDYSDLKRMYPEHNREYYNECVNNLNNKGYNLAYTNKGE